MATQVMTAQTPLPNFDNFISLYQNQIQQLHQEIKEMYTQHAKRSVRPRAQSVQQDLINTYVEYIAELDEFFNYPNSRGEFEN